MSTVWVLIGLLFGAPDGLHANMGVYSTQGACIDAEKKLMDSALAATNSTALAPAAKCVPMKVPTQT